MHCQSANKLEKSDLLISQNKDPYKIAPAYLRVTTACNGTCAMCDFWHRSPVEMPLHIVSEILSWISYNGYSEIILTGGEPLLAENLSHILSVCRDVGLHPSVITNGSMLSSPLVYDYGNDAFQRYFISIDSPWPNTHDTVRGVACISSIESWLKTCNQDTEIVVNTILSVLNKDDILDLPVWMSRHRISTINVIYMKSRKFALEEQQLTDLLCNLLEECHKYGIRHFVPGSPHGASCREAQKCAEQPFQNICFFRESGLFIEIDGMIYPCNCSSYTGKHSSLGQLFTIPFHKSDIIAMSREFNNTREKAPFSFCKNRCDLSNRLFNYNYLRRLGGVI